MISNPDFSLVQSAQRNPQATYSRCFRWLACAALMLVATVPCFAQGFTAGDLVVSVYGDGVTPQADQEGMPVPITLTEFATSGGSSVMSLQLSTVNQGVNHGITGEFGSSSEGTIQLSGNGQYLTIMGYNNPEESYNTSTATWYYSAANTSSYSTTPAIYTPTSQVAQSRNNGSAGSVPRVVALIGADGSVDTTTTVTNAFDGDNPRSAYTVDGSSFWISGQGVKGSLNRNIGGGVFSINKGSSTATVISGTYSGQTGGTVDDTRTVLISNGTLYVSRDDDHITSGTNIRALTTASGGIPTSSTGLVSTTITPGSVTLNGSNGNNINASTGTVNLSPEGFFFANPTTLYVADTGGPKNGGAGDGGLQKWVYSNGAWNLEYTLSAGLSLVSNGDTSLADNYTNTPNAAGLAAITGQVVGNNVYLYGVSYTGENDTTTNGLFSITDSLSSTTGAGENFTLLETAAQDTVFRGVSFTPQAAPEPGSIGLLASGAAALLGLRRRRA